MCELYNNENGIKMHNTCTYYIEWMYFVSNFKINISFLKNQGKSSLRIILFYILLFKLFYLVTVLDMA